jgi:hypothetical protein
MPESPRVQRRLRNYLLDARFQLKFTGYLVAVALAITVLLGAFLWRSSEILLGQTQQAVEARSRAAQTSHELGNVALSNALLERVNDPTFAAEVQNRSQAIDQEYERERAAIETQRAALVRQQRWTWVGLVGALVAFIVGIALAGIVTTHRIAGPLYRVKRLVATVGEGRLVWPERALRPGDELQDLVNALGQMVERLRVLQSSDLELLDKVASEVDKAGLSASAAELRTLQARLRERLTAPAS